MKNSSKIKDKIKKIMNPESARTYFPITLSTIIEEPLNEVRTAFSELIREQPYAQKGYSFYTTSYGMKTIYGLSKKDRIQRSDIPHLPMSEHEIIDALRRQADYLR